MSISRKGANRANGGNKHGETADKPAIDRALCDPRVLDVIDHMGANLHRKITLPELAKLVHLSTYHLSRLFKADTGVTPMQYLVRLRIEKAAELERVTHLSMKEITGRVGYNTYKNFLKHFKRHFGASPSEYRKEFLAERARRLQGLNG